MISSAMDISFKKTYRSAFDTVTHGKRKRKKKNDLTVLTVQEEATVKGSLIMPTLLLDDVNSTYTNMTCLKGHGQWWHPIPDNRSYFEHNSIAPSMMTLRIALSMSLLQRTQLLTTYMQLNIL